MKKEFIEAVIKIQSELKAPKNQVNKFGGYKYRSCEDILEAVKPILTNVGIVLLISDELVMIGERYYVKATATLTDGESSISNTAFAREEETKKGADGSQITGASSSYARKYALNGLFCIDDTKDSDTTNTHGKEDKPQPTATKSTQTAQPTATIDPKPYIDKINSINDVNELTDYWRAHAAIHNIKEIRDCVATRGLELRNK